MKNVWDNVKRGIERIAVCRDCRCTSAGDIRGLGAFTNVLRGGGCIEVCKECAAVDAWGNAAYIQQLIKATKEAVAVPRLEMIEVLAPFEQFKVVCFPAVAVREPGDYTLYIGETEQECDV